MNLDPDDEYKGRNNLNYLYNKAKNLNVDFITFFIFYLPSRDKSGQYSEFNKVLIQPELFESAFDNNYLNDFYITNKFIKRELLEISLQLFKNEIYGEKWNYHEDNIWSILLHKYANSSVFLNRKIYYYYYKNIDSEIFNRGNILELKNLIYRHNMFIKIFKYKNEEKYLFAGYSELIYIFTTHIDVLYKNKEFTKKSIKYMNEFINNHQLPMEIKKNYDDLLKKLQNISLN